MSKHTPGPWEVAYTDTAGQLVVSGEHIEIATCWHHSVGSIEQEMQANARLIAAAPELLASLKEFIDSRTPDHADAAHPGAYEWALAAIAKAEGR